MTQNPKTLDRRTFLQGATLVVSGLATGYGWASLAAQNRRPAARIALLTDIHHADAPARGTRFYRESMAKLQEAIAAFQKEKPDAAIELGDIIDTPTPPSKENELRFLREVSAEYKKAAPQVHYVVGNHCLAAMSKPEFLRTVGQDKTYYSFDLAGWHLIILDACFRADGTPYDSGNFHWTDTDLGQEQTRWLAQDLAQTKNPTVVFVHQRLDLEPGHDYAIATSPQIRKILSDSKKVAAVFMGHYHQNTLQTIDGVAYATLHALIEGSGPENNAYSLLELFPDRSLRIKGFRHHTRHPLAQSP